MEDIRTPLDLPGMAEALEQEQIERSAAYHALYDHVGEFIVTPMTLQQYSILRLARSPLLTVDRIAQPTDIVQFLWLLSTDFTPIESKAKQVIRRRCRMFYPPAPPLFKTRRALERWDRRKFDALRHCTEITDAIRQFVRETFFDAPEPTGASHEPDYYSDECAIIMHLARQTGWSRQEILQMPLKQIFQCLKEIRYYRAITSVPPQPHMLSNPSERIIDDYLGRVNQKN